SPLWPELRALLGPADDAAWRLATALVRPDVAAGPRPPGVATGSPIATALANLYLMPLDAPLAAAPFYAPYGDDLLVAAPAAPPPPAPPPARPPPPSPPAPSG